MVNPEYFAYLDDVKNINYRDYFLAMYQGVVDSAGIIILVVIAGGALAIMTESGAMNAGIKTLLKKTAGRENLVILLFMAIFSLLGTLEVGEGGTALCSPYCVRGPWI